MKMKQMCLKVQKHLQKLADDRLIALVSDHRLSVRNLALKYEAVRSLKKDEKFIEDNVVLLQELNLYEDDITFEINTVLEQDFHRKAGTQLYLEKMEKKWSVGLQQIGTTI